MTKEEEEQEKARVSHLSPDEKDAELRKLNREIARLETLKGINTGELYTWTGRYKALVRVRSNGHINNKKLVVKK